MQLSVPTIGLRSFDQRQPGLEDQTADFGVSYLQDFGSTVRERPHFVGLGEAPMFGLLHSGTPVFWGDPHLRVTRLVS